MARSGGATSDHPALRLNNPAGAESDGKPGPARTRPYMVTSITRFVLPCASLLALLPPRLVADTSPENSARQAILAGWGQYDPSIREAHLAASAATPPAAPITPPAPNTVPAASPTAPLARDGIVILPTMTVEGVRPKPRPRLHIREPVKNLPGNPFETPESRRARLVQKHFTPLEQALGRIKLPLIGQSLESRAAQLEAIEAAALQLNDIADLLELSLLLGLESPEEQKALRKEFLKASQDRPR